MLCVGGGACWVDSMVLVLNRLNGVQVVPVLVLAFRKGAGNLGVDYPAQTVLLFLQKWFFFPSQMWSLWKIKFLYHLCKCVVELIGLISQISFSFRLRK